MVVKSQIKFIKKLQQKKYRNQSGLFVAEGVKLVKELVKSRLEPVYIYVTEPGILESGSYQQELVNPRELAQMSGMKSPNKVLAVFRIPEEVSRESAGWVLALDAVQDPGNLGTIIRLADWFGIRQIWCSADTVDCYNPKVLQASMGAIGRVNLIYGDLVAAIAGADLPVYGAYMQGEVSFEMELPQAGILVMGNEANGISESVAAQIHSRISIPQFGANNGESLNVATATAVLLYEIRRDRGTTQK